MRLDSIHVDNFRCFDGFTAVTGGGCLFVVGENASGKSSLLASIAKALGRDPTASLADFRDPLKPIEIVATLSGFDTADQGVFPSELKFHGKPTLRIGFRATWDPALEEAETCLGFPDLGWKKASREQREGLPVFWLPAWRDANRILQVGSSRSLLSQLLSTLNLDPALGAALGTISGALASLAGTAELTSLFGDARAALAGMIPGVDQHAFSLTAERVSARELIRDFELLVSHSGPALPVSRQSNGLAQLAVFSFVLQILKRTPKAILLVDEPEISLHPQAQRALVATIRTLPNQAIVATHSSNVLDRADPRTILRLGLATAGVSGYHPAALTEADARWLSRFANPQTTEACFARKAVLVEGYSDRIAVLRFAERLGRDLDSEGVSVLSLEGGQGIGAHLRLLGKQGLGVEVLGFCDEDKEQDWVKQLASAGMPVTDRASMASSGFFVCLKDLEQEMIRSLGLAGTQAVIAAEGEAAAFAKFCGQPTQSGHAPDEQLRRFLHRDNIRWVGPLVDAIDLSALPGCVNDLFSRL